MGPILHHTTAERHATPHDAVHYNSVSFWILTSCPPSGVTSERSQHRTIPSNSMQDISCNATPHDAVRWNIIHHRHYHHEHLSLNREGRWGTTDDFPTSFLHFHYSPLPSGTWQTPGLSIPLYCFPTSFSVCLIFFPLSLCLARWLWPDLMNGRHDHTTAVCVSLRWSGGLRVVRLPAGSWHGLPRWKSMQ